MAELISQAEYARRRGVSRQAVHKAVRAGRLSLFRGKIDPEVADQQWAAKADPARGGDGGATSLGNLGTVAPEKRGNGGRPAGTPPPSSEAAGIYQHSRAEREQALARLAKLELLEREGELLSTQEVRKAVFSAARAARDLLRAMADRLAPEVAGREDVAQCHALITGEVERACEELSSALPGA